MAPPIRYGYHGLGELLVGINMGPIMVVGTYWVIAGQPAWRPLYVSIPVGLMVASILYYQSLPDMSTDFAAGKQTLALMLGRKGSMIGLVIFFALIYASIMVLVYFGILTWIAGLCIFTIPLFLKLLVLVNRTGNWILLDRYGKYVRMLYFINGLVIMAGLF